MTKPIRLAKEQPVNLKRPAGGWRIQTRHPLRAFVILGLSAGVLAVVAVERASAQTSGADDSKYLVFDTRVLNELANAYLVIGEVQKDSRNPLFGPDKPWEVSIDNMYPNVIYDKEKQIYKCWYNPFIVDSVIEAATEEIREKMNRRQAEAVVKVRNVRETGVCYATSKDGYTWEKPELGIIKYDGRTNNNLVLRAAHGVGVIKDPDDPDPKRRYKMFLKRGEMGVAFSEDGLHWPESIDCPQIDAAGDTHNNALWVPELKKWVGFTRLWQGSIRVVGRTESPDFTNWTKAQEVLRGTWRQCHVYAMPVFRYANLYLGLPMIFDKGRDVVYCELAWSPDTLNWSRLCPGTPLIPRGPEGSYDWGCVFAAAYPLVYDTSIRLYYGGSDGQHYDFRKGYLCLATLRLDRWAGYQHSGKRSGFVGFRPVTCTGKKLLVTADINGGSIKMTVFDSSGEEITPAITLSDNVTGHPVADLSDHVGKPVRVRFELKDATVYSFAFADD